MANISTPPVRRLHTLLDETQDGSLITLENECTELMKEIELTSKEVKGDPEESIRYLTAREIKSQIRGLKSLAAGTYTFVLATNPVKAGS